MPRSGVASGRSAFLEQQATRRGALAVGLLAVAAAVPLQHVDSGPVICPVRRLTDVPCPGCGLTRSLTRTMHGQVRSAVEAHPAGPALVGLLVGWALTGPAHAGTAMDPSCWLQNRRRRIVVCSALVLWLVWACLRAAG